MWLFWFARAWIWFGNGAGCTFVLGTAALYTYVLSEPLVSFTTTRLETNILQYFTPTIGICYAVVAGHGILLVRTAQQSLRQRWRTKSTRVVHPTVVERPILTQDKSDSAQPAMRTSGNSIMRRVLTRVELRAAAFWEWWTRYRAEITRLFVLWEVGNQTYQANKMSRLIASVWINRLVSLVIIVNCWFSLVLQYVMRSRHTTYVRLTRLLIDSCVDVVYSIGIPLVIFYPYYRDYGGSQAVFPVVNFYMDTWYADAVSELRQVFVTSWVDLVSKATGAIALLYRLYIVELVLRKAQDLATVSNGRELGSAHDSATHFIRSQLRSRLSKILDAVLLLWGFTVLCLQIHSTLVAFQGDRVGCLLETRPWGSSTYACMVLEVSCVDRHIAGRLPHIHDALHSVDPRFVQVLILSHCPQLEVPPIIQTLVALSMVKVYNTTLLTWDETAAFRDATNPALQVLYFARVNMSEIPTGLLAADFPQRVWDIEFCVTNLTSVPGAAAEAWQNIVYFAIEATPLLTELPLAVLRLSSVVFLRLGMNNIRSIPDGGFADQAFAFLSLDGNPLTRLPATIKTLKHMQMLGIQGTGVSSFPLCWVAAEPPTVGLVTVCAHGTPLCDDAGDPPSPTTIGPFSLDCRAGLSPMIEYPIAEEDMWRYRDGI